MLGAKTAVPAGVLMPTQCCTTSPAEAARLVVAGARSALHPFLWVCRARDSVQAVSSAYLVPWPGQPCGVGSHGIECRVKLGAEVG